MSRPARRTLAGPGFHAEGSFSALPGPCRSWGRLSQGLLCPLIRYIPGDDPWPQAWDGAAQYEDAHTPRLADLTRPHLERIMSGAKLRGRIMPAWKRSHAKAPEPKDREVGQLIRAQRLVCRMSQTELANALGVTFQQVQKYEKGVNRVGAGRLARIADTSS